MGGKVVDFSARRVYARVERSGCATASTRMGVRDMVAVRDVAKRAGVSTSTVSHVLNGTRFVSTELRERVRAAVADLDYQPNAAARSLTLKRSNTIGFIVSDIRNPYFASIARGVEDVAQAHGYKVVLCNTDEDSARASMYLQALQTRELDGVLVAACGAGDGYLARLIRAGMPVVLVDHELPEVVDAPAIVLDKSAEAYGGVEYLIGHGHRRIAMLCGGRRETNSTRDDCTSGYRRALAQSGVEFDERLLVAGPPTVEGGRQAARAVLDLAPPPTAIFSDNSLMGMGALAAIADRGLRIPEDVEIMSVDDLPHPWTDAFDPRLSTVSQPTYQLGRRAAEMLVNALRLSSAPSARVVFDGTPQVRESMARKIGIGKQRE